MFSHHFFGIFSSILHFVWWCYCYCWLLLTIFTIEYRNCRLNNSHTIDSLHCKLYIISNYMDMELAFSLMCNFIFFDFLSFFIIINIIIWNILFLLLNGNWLKRSFALKTFCFFFYFYVFWKVVLLSFHRLQQNNKQYTQLTIPWSIMYFA